MTVSIKAKQPKNTLLISFLAASLALGVAIPAHAKKQSPEEVAAVVKGKKIFQQYGLDDDLPKLGMSSLTQGEHLVEHVQRKLVLGDDISESSAYLVKNTDSKGNIDLRIKYNPEELAEADHIVDELETMTRTEYRLRNYAQSYDASSVKAIERGDGIVDISFEYSKYALPQDIAYFRFLTVNVEVQNGQPLRMTITNTKPFKFDKFDAQSYEQVIEFKHLENDKLFIASKKIVINGHYRKKVMRYESESLPVAFYDKTDGVSVMDEARLAEASDPRMQVKNVKLDRVFPLMGDMVRRQGIDMPLPYGISVAYRNQDMNIPFQDFVIEGVRLNELFDPEESFGVVNAESLTLRGDVNILPFWNVFGYLGKINVDANVDASYTGKAGEAIRDKLNDKLNGLGDAVCEGLSALCTTGRLNVPLHLEYDVRGLGTTLSVGYREFFASVTGTYSQTRLKGLDDWGEGIVTVQPMLGYQLVDYRAQFFVGAEYQGLDSRMQGTVKTGDIEFDYDIGVELNEWAFLTGFNKQIGKNYNMTVLYNKGETRDSLTVNLGYRF
ncbi:hypothetical protein RCJ22_37055 [Vibrio sp. FNV 38]|nr:hypothetical protein [Vibrio sp. FNV 38]